MFTPRCLSGCSVPPYCRSAAAIGKSRRRDGRKRPAPAAPAATASAPAYTPLTADQLYQLVSPVALFPDKLLAQVLAGAGYPDQISAADAAGAKPRPAAGGAQLGSRRSATGSQRARHGAISRRTRSNGENIPGPRLWAAPTSTIPPT